MASPVTEDQIRSFQEKGYLLVRSFLSPEEAKQLQQWSQEVHDLPRTEDTPYMPYEVRLSRSMHALFCK